MSLNIIQTQVHEIRLSEEELRMFDRFITAIENMNDSLKKIAEKEGMPVTVLEAPPGSWTKTIIQTPDVVPCACNQKGNKHGRNSND
jgi:hypothetical protein